MKDRTNHISTSGRVVVDHPELASSPDPGRLPDGQHQGHWALSEEERSKGYVRPVRSTYIHEKCGTETRMPAACAETYARQPDYYGSTFCCCCRDYFPVGAEGQFIWPDDRTKVGT